MFYRFVVCRVRRENIGFRPLQLRRLAIALAETPPESSPIASEPVPAAEASGTATGLELQLGQHNLPRESASNQMERPAGRLGPTPSVAPKVPRRNVYISPFMSQQDQEEEVVRVKSLMAELQVPGGTVRRVIPGKREWHITPV